MKPNGRSGCWLSGVASRAWCVAAASRGQPRGACATLPYCGVEGGQESRRTCHERPACGCLGSPPQSSKSAVLPRGASGINLRLDQERSLGAILLSGSGESLPFP